MSVLRVFRFLLVALFIAAGPVLAAGDDTTRQTLDSARSTIADIETTLKADNLSDSDLVRLRATGDPFAVQLQAVIVDLSPLTPVVDVRATSKLVDSYLFVVEWSRTKIDVAEHALSEARQVHDNVMGAILNKVNMKTMRRYNGYRGAYYGNRYYKRYGYAD